MTVETDSEQFNISVSDDAVCDVTEETIVQSSEGRVLSKEVASFERSYDEVLDKAFKESDTFQIIDPTPPSSPPDN